MEDLLRRVSRGGHRAQTDRVGRSGRHREGIGWVAGAGVPKRRNCDDDHLPHSSPRRVTGSARQCTPRATVNQRRALFHPRVGSGTCAATARRQRKGRVAMLHWAAVFFIISIVAPIFRFGRLAASPAVIATILFVVFLVLAGVSLLFGRRAVL